MGIAKINIKRIVIDHFKTLEHPDEKKIVGSDWLIFLITPLLIANVLIYYKIYINEQYVNIIISAFSIFVGLLFNVIVILFDVVKKENTKFIKKEVARELVVNISFAILIALFAIVFTIFTQIDKICTIKVISNSFTYFFISLFFLTLLLILKKMYFLFLDELID